MVSVTVLLLLRPLVFLSDLSALLGWGVSASMPPPAQSRPGSSGCTGEPQGGQVPQLCRSTAPCNALIILFDATPTHVRRTRLQQVEEGGCVKGNPCRAEATPWQGTLGFPHLNPPFVSPVSWDAHPAKPARAPPQRQRLRPPNCDDHPHCQRVDLKQRQCVRTGGDAAAPGRTRWRRRPVGGVWRPRSVPVLPACRPRPAPDGPRARTPPPRLACCIGVASGGLRHSTPRPAHPGVRRPGNPPPLRGASKFKFPRRSDPLRKGVEDVEEGPKSPPTHTHTPKNRLRRVTTPLAGARSPA